MVIALTGEVVQESFKWFVILLLTAIACLARVALAGEYVLICQKCNNATGKEASTLET